MAGSSADASPPPQPPWPKQPPLSDDETSKEKQVRQRLRRWVQGPVAQAKMAAIKETLGAFRQLESAPPPPPEPLPPPESEPEESDDDLGADDSSAYGEYENEHEVPDEDMSTVAPSDASVLIYTILERIARYRATEAAR